MAARTKTVTMQVRVRWWVKHYLAAVALGCYLTGRQPNVDRVSWWLDRGIRLRDVRAPAEVQV